MLPQQGLITNTYDDISAHLKNVGPTFALLPSFLQSLHDNNVSSKIQ